MPAFHLPVFMSHERQAADKYTRQSGMSKQADLTCYNRVLTKRCQTLLERCQLAGTINTLQGCAAQAGTIQTSRNKPTLQQTHKQTHAVNTTCCCGDNACLQLPCLCSCCTPNSGQTHKTVGHVQAGGLNIQQSSTVEQCQAQRRQGARLAQKRSYKPQTTLPTTSHTVHLAHHKQPQNPAATTTFKCCHRDPKQGHQLARCQTGTINDHTQPHIDHTHKFTLPAVDKTCDNSACDNSACLHAHYNCLCSCQHACKAADKPPKQTRTSEQTDSTESMLPTSDRKQQFVANEN
jgi:hypothetical protein